MGLLDLREYRREPKRYGSLLNYDALDEALPWLMYLRDNSLLATMQLRGPDLESAEDHALVTQASQLNQIFRRFGSGWCLMSEARHVEVVDYPEASWPEPVSAAVDAERRQFFTQPGQHFVTEAYLTLSWRQPQQKQGRWEQRLYANVPEGVDPATWAVESFTDEVERTRRMLAGPAATVHLLAGAALLTYLHSCATFHTHGVRVPEPAVYLNTYLSQDVDYNAGLYPSLGAVEDPEVWIACVSPQEQHGQPAFPNVTYPGILNVLNTLPFPWRCTQRYLPLNRDEAAKIIRRYAQQHMGARQKGLGNRLNRYKKNAEVNLVVDKIAEDRAQEAQDAQAMVEAGHWSQGYLTLTVVLWDKDRAVLARKVQQTEAALRDEQFMAKSETYNTGDAWIGSMPGDHKANVRQPLMTSLNFAHAFPATAAWRGPERNEHLGGPCVLQATTKHKTPVRVSLHVNDVSHTAIIGSTGDGKSTFLNFLALQWRRYPGAEVAIFDKGGAAQVLTYLVGGTWYDLGVMPLQPLAEVETLAEMTWAVDWLEALLLQERVSVTPDMKEAIFLALQELSTWDVPKRTMSNLMNLIDHPLVQQGLRLYTQHGPYGLVLDADHDSLSFEPWLCFEIASILETPRLLGAVLPVIFHRLEQRLMGQPKIFIAHEAWLAFSTPYWQDRLRAQLKGLRVKNAGVVMATQSLADAVDSPIMPAILDNVSSWILTPNSKAEEEEIGKYYRAIGLQARQRELLRLGTKKRDYYLMNDGGQAMIDLALGPVALAACRTHGPGELARYAAMYADDSRGFVTKYFQEFGIDLR